MIRDLLSDLASLLAVAGFIAAVTLIAIAVEPIEEGRANG